MKNEKNLRDIQEGETIIDEGKEFLVIKVPTALKKYKPHIIVQDNNGDTYDYQWDDSQDDVYVEVKA